MRQKKYDRNEYQKRRESYNDMKTVWLLDAVHLDDSTTLADVH